MDTNVNRWEEEYQAYRAYWDALEENVDVLDDSMDYHRSTDS